MPCLMTTTEAGAATGSKDRLRNDSPEQKARQHTIEDKLEAGLVLAGWEVKALRAGRINWRRVCAFKRP